MDLMTVLLLLLIFGLLMGSILLLSSRCPSCRAFLSLARTGADRAAAGFPQAAEEEWRCRRCGHRAWRLKHGERRRAG